jgi:hypothetical protein
MRGSRPALLTTTHRTAVLRLLGGLQQASPRAEIHVTDQRFTTLTMSTVTTAAEHPS